MSEEFELRQEVATVSDPNSLPGDDDIGGVDSSNGSFKIDFYTKTALKFSYEQTQ